MMQTHCNEQQNKHAVGEHIRLASGHMETYFSQISEVIFTIPRQSEKYKQKFRFEAVDPG